MSEYYSDKLRELSKSLESNEQNHMIVNMIWARIVEDAAKRIDELQRQVAAGLEQSARLSDRISHIKRDISARLTEDDHENIDNEAAKKFRDYDRSRGSVRPQIILPQDDINYWTVVATQEFLVKKAEDAA